MITLINKIIQFPEKALLLQMLFLAAVVKVLLKITSYQQTVKITAFIAKYCRKTTMTFLELQDLSYRLFSSFNIFDNCLVRTLTIFTVFKNTFPSLEIKLGVNEQDGFQAHAWIEIDGQVIDSGQSEFEVIYSEN